MSKTNTLFQMSKRAMSTGRLEGKVAIVTASTKGIGYAIAEKFAVSGARVIISSRRSENVDAALKSLRDEKNLTNITGTVCHTGNKEDRTKLIQKAINDHGKLDILVSNAGINPHFGSIFDVEEEIWDKLFDMNVKSAFLLAKESMPHLTKTKGNMLFVSSIAGYTPLPFIGAYSVSKTALLGLIGALSKEAAPMGVRVNGLAPGLIDTDFSSALKNNESIYKTAVNMTPLGRFGNADECAGAAEFLCSDDASFVTGETLNVTGGLAARL